MPAIAPQGLRRPTGQLPGGDAPVADVGFVDQIGAGFRTAKDDISYVQDDRLLDAYRPVMSALEDINGKSHWQYKDWLKELNPFANGGLQYDYDSVWRDVLDARQKNPAAFKELPATRDEFEKGVLTRQGQRAKDQQLLARGDSFVAPLLGAVGASIFDPVNVATMPIGGGSKTIGQAFLREAIINGGIELVQQVPLAAARERMGEELTVKEAATNVGAGFIFGGVLGAGGKYGADNWDAIKSAPKAVQEALWAKIAPVLPEGIRPKMDWDAIGDDMIPDIAEAVIGRENLSEAEADALAVVRRESAIEARNPFMRDGAGVRVHEENLAAAMQRIFDSAPAQPISRAAVPRISRETLNRGTSISSGVVAGDARSVVKSRIGIVESGGSNSAKNSRSSATGTYQFVTGTWVKLYTSRFGKGGMSDAQIAAKRSDPRLQEILMDDLMDVNEGALRNAGVPQTAGNIYLAHFAGSGGAVKLHRASPDASARSVLGADAVDANPFLAPMSAADVINWAARKMGGSTGSPPSTRSGQSAFDGDSEAAVRADLERQQTQIDADRAALDDTLRPAQGERDILDDILPDPIHDGGDIPILATPIQAREMAGASPVAPRVPLSEDALRQAQGDRAVQEILPDLRKLVRKREMSLNEPAKLGETLGVDEALVRRALIQMAAGKEIRMNKKGQFAQQPRDLGPIDIQTFAARAGGLTENGLSKETMNDGIKSHRLGKGGRDWHKTLIARAGPLVQKNGRSLDEMGELLHEAGYFGDPQGPRPTENQVLQALDDAVQTGKKIYPFGDAPEARAAANMRDPWLDEFDRADMQRDFDRAAEQGGYALDDEAFGAAARLYADGDYDSPSAAITAMINREIEADRAATLYEAGDDYYDAQIEQFIADARAAGFDLDEGIDGPEVLARDAGAQGKAGGDDIGDAAQKGSAELERATERSFDARMAGLEDPHSPESRAVIDGMIHDLQMLADLDPEASFRLSDDGPEQAVADVLAEFDATKNEIAALKACMLPKGAG